MTLKPPACLDDDDIWHDKVALNTHKAAARLGVEPTYHGNRAFDDRIGVAAQLGQALDIALGKQLYGLLADGHGGARFITVLAVKQLQAQAFSKIARAHTGRLHVVQQLERHGKVLFQLFKLGRIALCLIYQAGGQRCQAVFKVTIIVQRLDQKMQGCAVNA